MKTKISAYQLFTTMAVFQYGTAVFFFLGAKAKQDAWIAILIYSILGSLLQILYTSIWTKYPEDTLITYLPKIYGKTIGYILSILYVLYFEYIAARTLRSIAELIIFEILPDMNFLTILILLILVMTYGISKGMERMHSVGPLLLSLIVLILILQWIFLLTTPHVFKINNLKPVLEDGIIPVIKNGWPLITFPFGEPIAFTMFYPLVRESCKIRKATVFSVLLAGILLATNTVMFIGSLGANYASKIIFPLIQTFHLIQVGQILERIDIFAILMVVLVGSYKIAFFLCSAMLGTSQLLKLKDTKYLAIPFGIVTLIISRLVAHNYSQHYKLGLEFAPKYIHLPAIIIIPLITFIVYHFKKLFN